MSIPRATVRLQLHRDFTLNDACGHVSYFAKLGISHLYCSPISTAVAGSTHGYDVVDPQTISPELGGEAAFVELAHSARAHGMGIILDIVPNHMATHSTNSWWWDILRLGSDSAYADWLDIDWFSPDTLLTGKVLAPFLAQDYASSLRAGRINLIHDPQSQSFQIEADGARYPLAPDSLRLRDGSIAQTLANHDPGTPSGRDCLHALLQRQNYVLAWWRCAADRINWRRFFEISGLIGVCVEEPKVFDAVHALPLRLFSEGLVDGVRVDHVDGLAQPLAYCRQLRKALQACSAQRPDAQRYDEPWLVVEKILGSGELLDSRWAVHGTTGYDFMDQVGAWLHDPAGEAALSSHWLHVSGRATPPQGLLEEARSLMLERHFAAEYCSLLRVLARLAQSRIATRDWTLPAIDRVLQVLLAVFPVYRTYVEDRKGGAADFDRCAPVLEEVHRRLARQGDGPEHELLDALAVWLGIAPPNLTSAEKGVCGICGILQQEAIRRFQQLTPPLAAKSLEDTAFYRYGRLLSRNEVGSSLEVFALSPEGLHHHNAWRAVHAPQSMLATATHDQKRGEDARARLAVLSEVPYLWAANSRRWLHALNAQDKHDPSPALVAERYMLLQTLVGSWPLDLSLDDRRGLERYTERLLQWLLKAEREAKINSSWFEPDQAHEAATAEQLRRLMLGARDGLLADIERFISRIAAAGALNSFAQTILRMTVPGVPDLYQGSELWDFSLVDPDNRRPVDFAARAQALDALSDGGIHGLIADWRTGRIKQAMIARMLQARRELPGLFARGAYSAVPLDGPHNTRALAFLRTDAEQAILVVVPRMCTRAVASGHAESLPMVPPAFWADTHAVLPGEPGEPGQPARSVWRDIMTDMRTDVAPDGRVALGDVLSHFPVAVLRREARGT